MTILRAALTIALLVACGKKEESAHMKRARELLSIGEWANARTELKLEVKDHPQDTEARGLLLYCIDRSDGLDKISDFGMLDLYSVLVVVGGPDWEKVPQEGRDYVNKALISTRQKLYDKGVDTKDPADLAAVIVAAARFGFDKDDDKERKDALAAILARNGDAPALEYLVERLKSQKPETVIDYLAAVGSAAGPPLQKVVADRAFIGRSAALQALARIQTIGAVRAFVADSKDLRDPIGHDLKVVGTDSLGHDFGAGKWDPNQARAHAQYASLDKEADGILLLQSWNDATKAIVVGVFAFRDGEMKRLRVTGADGKTFELGGPSAVFGLQAEAGLVKLHRLQQRTTNRDIETGRVTKPEVGMQVRLQGYSQRGQIVREDEGGLWVVHVEKPIEGMNELTVAASKLIGVKTEPFTATATELLTAKLSGDMLQITQTAMTNDMMARFAEFTDQMCSCTAGDKDCAMRVQKEMQRYVDTHKDVKEDKLSDEDMKKATDLGVQMAKCSSSAMGSGDKWQ